MTMQDPMERIAAWMRQEFEVEIYDITHNLVGQSPIEHILMAACRAHSQAVGNEIRILSQKQFPNETIEEAMNRVIRNVGRCYGYRPQARIDNYIVDFLFVDMLDGPLKMLVVECDGHEFHERTKEQAAKDRSRDRHLQELGYTVFRFTGSEIYRDPIKCAQQITSWLWSLK